MMEVYKFIKPLVTNLGSHQIGERLFKEPSPHLPGSNYYYPEKGGYPIWYHSIKMEDFIVFVEDTDKPKEYFINKVYSQYQVDEMLKK